MKLFLHESYFLNNKLSLILFLAIVLFSYSFSKKAKSISQKNKIIEKIEDEKDIYHKNLLENFRNLSRENLLKIIGDSKLKYYRVKPEVIILRYYAFKYQIISCKLESFF